MTRKTCTKQPHVDIVLQSVCPELFCLGRTRLGYPKRVTQRKTTANHSFLDLDNLCRTDSALKLFLKLNGININYNREETKLLRSASMARNKMRTRTSSVCYKVKQSPQSPDYGHRLRARRHTTFANNFADTSGDDDSNHVKPMRELRSSSRLSLAQVKAAEHEQEQDTWESGRPKRSCIKQKRISADERLVVDNKNYYKVEVMRNKLRSSDVVHRETEISVRKKIKSPPPVSEDSEDDKGLLVKFPFRKLRNTELTRLNNEAENFLFPRKDDSSSEDDTDADGSNTSPVNSKKGDHAVLSSDSSSKPNKSSKNEPEEETSMDSTSSETSSVTRKKRRLTQAEAFILDNQRYYKFETPGSRLRYQGSYLAPIAAKNNGEYSTKKHTRSKEHHTTESIKPKFELDELKFSFELVPKTESWYKTFQRQDNGDEYYSCYSYSNPGFYKPFLLPYEMGPLPPLDPRYCLHGYNQMKKRFLGDAVPTTSATSNTPDSCSANTPVKLDELSSTGEDTKSSEDSTLPNEFPQSFFRKSKPGPKPGSRRGFGGGKNPRKSPRQHASTLAILSSLIHQRKRREQKARVSDQNKHNLSSITEEEKSLEPEPDYEEMAKNISDMLSSSMGEFDSVGALDGVDVHCRPDVVYALQDSVNYKEDYDGPTIGTLKLATENTTVRKPYRKKKKNRTGWPNKNRRVFRKEGSDSRDGLGSSEPDNSVANSPSVQAESEGNEENVEDNNCNTKKNSLSKSYIDNRNTNIDKINGDVQVQPHNKLNGVNDNYELNFRSTPKRKEHRESSSDNCAEVVIASVGDKIDCVNVGLDEWENAERVLAAKLRSEAINNDIQFQPIVRVQKLDSDAVKRTEKRLRTSPSPRRTRPRRMPASPKSPRMLRRPRGGWYRERFNNN